MSSQRPNMGRIQVENKQQAFNDYKIYINKLLEDKKINQNKYDRYKKWLIPSKNITQVKRKMIEIQDSLNVSPPTSIISSSTPSTSILDPPKKYKVSPVIREALQRQRNIPIFLRPQNVNDYRVAKENERLRDLEAKKREKQKEIKKEKEKESPEKTKKYLIRETKNIIVPVKSSRDLQRQLIQLILEARQQNKITDKEAEKFKRQMFKLGDVDLRNYIDRLKRMLSPVMPESVISLPETRDQFVNSRRKTARRILAALDNQNKIGEKEAIKLSDRIENASYEELTDIIQNLQDRFNTSDVIIEMLGDEDIQIPIYEGEKEKKEKKEQKEMDEITKLAKELNAEDLEVGRQITLMERMGEARVIFALFGAVNRGLYEMVKDPNTVISNIMGASVVSGDSELRQRKKPTEPPAERGPNGPRNINPRFNYNVLSAQNVQNAKNYLSGLGLGGRNFANNLYYLALNNPPIMSNLLTTLGVTGLVNLFGQKKYDSLVSEREVEFFKPIRQPFTVNLEDMPKSITEKLTLGYFGKPSEEQKQEFVKGKTDEYSKKVQAISTAIYDNPVDLHAQMNPFITQGQRGRFEYEIPFEPYHEKLTKEKEDLLKQNFVKKLKDQKKLKSRVII